VGLNQIEEIEITYVMSTSSVPEFVIVCNSRVGDIFKINGLLAAFVAFSDDKSRSQAVLPVSVVDIFYI
jgi:hypothetical protein